MSEIFKTLNEINVNDRVESKNNLSYLSWSWAWAEVKKQYPNAKYEIWKNEYGYPYIYDPNAGYMVFTKVTIEDLTHEMWLPVMDNQNNAMKAEPYKIKKWGKDIDVQPATMFEINKAIMRCLVKNLAMFGLGLYIYAGEDLPESEAEQLEPRKTQEELEEDAKTRTEFLQYIAGFTKEDLEAIAKFYKVSKPTEMNAAQCADYLNRAKNKEKESK